MWYEIYYYENTHTYLPITLIQARYNHVSANPASERRQDIVPDFCRMRLAHTAPYAAGRRSGYGCGSGRGDGPQLEHCRLVIGPGLGERSPAKATDRASLGSLLIASRLRSQACVPLRAPSDSCCIHPAEIVRPLCGEISALPSRSCGKVVPSRRAWPARP